MTQSTKVISAPAPWQLTGEAYIMIFKFKRDFVENSCFLEPFQAKTFSGFVGTVMLVNYQNSPVGPYYELLLIPGIFNINKKKVFSISKIYVSSLDSVVNGIQNWGIPKEMADFEWINVDKNTVEISIKVAEKSFFKAKIENNNFVFPITTSIIPFTIIQKLGVEMIITNPKANGNASFAKINEINVDQQYFPDISKIKPIATLCIKKFKMVFNIPKKMREFDLK